MTITQLFDWMRAPLRGPRTPARHRRPATPVTPSPARTGRLASNVLGARLVNARRHRTEQRTAPPQTPQLQPRAVWFPPRDWEATDAMARPYALSLEERKQPLSVREFAEVSR